MAWGNQRGSCPDHLTTMILLIVTTRSVRELHYKYKSFLLHLWSAFVMTPSQMFWGLWVYCGCKMNWARFFMQLLYHNECLWWWSYIKQSGCLTKWLYRNWGDNVNIWLLHARYCWQSYFKWSTLLGTFCSVYLAWFATMCTLWMGFPAQGH